VTSGKRLRHTGEYAATLALLALLDRLSPTMTFRLADRLGGLLYRLDAPRRRIAIGNVLRAGIATTRADAARIAQASFRHFARLIAESLKSSELFDETNWQDVVALQFDPLAEAALRDPDRGVILVSGHFGNWEIAAQVTAFVKPVVAIARDMNNPLVDALIKARKTRPGLTLTPKRDADMLRLLGVLKRRHVLALLTDQFARDRGMLVDFFGSPASTHTSAALLHLVTRVPLVFGTCIRTPDGGFAFHAPAPLDYRPTGNKESDIRHILETLNGMLEAAIRANPEQYLWAHRRWRDRPA